MSLQKTTLSIACFVMLLTACSKQPEREYADVSAPMGSGAIMNEQSAAVTEPIIAEPIVPVAIQETPKPTVVPKHQNRMEEPTSDELSVLDTELTNPALANKKLIVNGSLHFEVADVRQTASYIQALSGSHGGYVASESIRNEQGRSEEVAIGDGKFRQMTEYTPTASLTVRIPKKEVNAFLQNLQTRIEFLIASDMDAKDASLEVKKAQLEAQISALKVSKLDRLNDTAQTPNGIQAQINVVDKTTETQLTQLHAQLSEQAIEDQVELATLRLDFFEHKKLHLRTTASLESQLAKEKRANFSGRLKASLSVGWSYALELFLLVAKLWVFALVVGFLWFGLPKFWHWFRHRAKNKPNARPVIHVPANPSNNNEPPKV